MSQSQVIAITLIFYQVTLISIGIFASKKIKSNVDFLLGGRQLGPWVAGLSYAASTSSAWVLIGFSGFVFTYGFSALWMMPGIWGGYIIMWLNLGPTIRSQSSAMRWVTPTEFICANVEKNNKEKIAVLAAFLIAFCFIFYIAAQFDAASDAFSSNFNISPRSSLVLGALIILFYCLLGGFWAASLTDTIQAIVMVCAAVSVSVVTYIEAGGYQDISLSLNNIENFTSWSGGYKGFLLIGLLAGVIGIGSGTFGQPHLIARLMAVKGEKELKTGFKIAFFWVIIIYLAMAILGISARSLLDSSVTGEEIFYIMAEDLLPPVLSGIVIASVLSAVMSTVDSLLLASSSAVSHDLKLAKYLKYKELTVSRLVMTMIVFLAILLAWTLPDSIFNRVLFAWSALGAAFGAIVIARVLEHEPSYHARISSILIGFFSTVLFYTFGNIDPTSTSNGLFKVISYLGNLPGDPFERLIPFILSCFVIFAFSKTK